MKYLVLDDVSSAGIQLQVNKLIAAGWAPLGGVSIYVVFENPHFAQAMIKDKE